MHTIQRAVTLKMAGSVRKFLKNGESPDQACKTGYSILAIAAGNGDGYTVRELLEGGADPDYQGSEPGYTPLRASIIGGSALCTMLLLQAGANPKIAGWEGWDAYELAHRRNCFYSKRLLKEYDAGTIGALITPEELLKRP